MDVIRELGTLALNHVEASWALSLIQVGQPPEVALMTVFKHCLVVNGQLRDQLEKYTAWNAQEFVELQNSMKGERNEGYEGTE